jgi:rubrerythrin
MSLADKLAGLVGDDEPDSDEVYECADCGTRFTLDRQTCPDCDGCTIDRIDWERVTE